MRHSDWWNSLDWTTKTRIVSGLLSSNISLKISKDGCCMGCILRGRQGFLCLPTSRLVLIITSKINAEFLAPPRGRVHVSLRGSASWQRTRVNWPFKKDKGDSPHDPSASMPRASFHQQCTLVNICSEQIIHTKCTSTFCMAGGGMGRCAQPVCSLVRYWFGKSYLRHPWTRNPFTRRLTLNLTIRCSCLLPVCCCNLSVFTRTF